MAQTLSWIVIFSILVPIIQCYSTDNKKYRLLFEPAWTYKCVYGEGCQRSNRPLSSTTNFTQWSSGETNVYSTMEMCWSVCSRFGGLWPRPVSATLSTKVVKIHPESLRYDLIDVPEETRPLLEAMTQIATRNLMAECGGIVSDFAEKPVIVYITVNSADIKLNFNTSEQYMLEVQTNANDVLSVLVVADSVFGARHALESFTQLTSSVRTSDQCSLFIVSGAKIRDKPAYRYRGLLLDTARHFISIDSIKRTLEGMAASKMNVFHWHVTDSHSFPLESARVPQFTRFGAYSGAEIYTAKDVRDIMKFAEVRGIRVVMEIDTPAHAGNGWQWGKKFGFGDMAVCTNAKDWKALCLQPPCGQLNPANPSMYTVLRDLYRDIAESLPKPALFHMGGDEVSFRCWESSDEITTYMRDKGLDIGHGGFMRLWAEFHSKALKIWDEEYEAAGGERAPPVMIWSSELTAPGRVQKYLNSDRWVIEVWAESQDSPLVDLLNLGYRAVSSPPDVWYLDRVTKWYQMYSHRLPRIQNMLGGEACMWTELIDEHSLDVSLWPRTAAVAERLWSDPTSKPIAAEPRLQRHRARLIARGLRPDSLSPEWCSQHDNRCKNVAYETFEAEFRPLPTTTTKPTEEESTADEVLTTTVLGERIS